MAHDFSDRIILQQRGPQQWQTVATLPAQVTPIEGDDTITQKVVIRAYPLISTDMRVLWLRGALDLVLQIQAIAEEQHGTRMALACSEVGLHARG
jgi:hypothetical protein